MEFMDTVLIVGSGGREHALLRAMLNSNRELCMYGYPGNPGMESDGCTLVDGDIDSWGDLADWAEENEVDLVVVGPELPLVEGITDLFLARGIPVFGPTRDAARIEGSKHFAKTLMNKYGIPTAAFAAFTDEESALAYLEEKGAPVVVKASGLAAGKGAIVCDTKKEAQQALARMFDEKAFGDAGATVILEEKMTGEEASVLVLTDGKDYKVLPVSQDHKAALDGDKGPNTGGMGAYAPAPLVDDLLLARIEKEIIQPTLHGMSEEGCPYQGLLYAGVMITPDGPKVVEYNCRFGDPETQAVLPLVECDWFEVFAACTAGTLASVNWKTADAFCVAVVVASGGYPGKYEKGKVITGIEAAERNKANVDVYHAGTARNAGGELVTNGGRVLAVSACGDTLELAVKNAYENVSLVAFDGCTFRHDIGAKGLARLKKA